MQTVYVDVLIALNLLISWAMLRTCGELCRRRAGRGRMALASLLGGMSSLIILLPQLPGFDEALSLAAPGGVSESAPAEISSAPSEPEPDGDAVSAPESGPEPEDTTLSSPPLESTENPETASAPEEEPEIAPENQAVLVHKTYTTSPSEVFVQVGNAFVKNVTDYANSVVLEAEAASPAFTLEDTSEPQVLIMHTHTTESYMPFTGDAYDTTYPSRTTDNTQKLQEAGIGVIHDTTQHDYPSYNGSYDRSAETVKGILAQYPSIKVVLDIHRDAIISGDTVTAPVVESDEGTAAQVMIISGCDDGTMDYPDWRENLAFAIDLQQQMEADHPGFTRPVLFDYRFYNQNLTTGSLLIEVGGHGNTLSQAKLAGEWIGESLAALLKG